jgi:hypothetical protein
MNTMTTHFGTAPRHVRRVGLGAALLSAVALLAGCSSSADSYGAPEAYPGDAAYTEVEAPGLDGFSSAERDAAGFSDDVNTSSTTDRSVIITGSMYMTVEDPIVAADRAAGIVVRAGGRVDARRETAPDEYYGGSASLTLRIPSDDLDEVIEELRDLGTVDQLSTNSYDVTVEVTDLDARISTLRASTERIEALLVDAKDISDIITLENELTYRQAELQSLEAQQRGLDDQVSMSTIDLSLTTEPVVIVDDDPETFWDALKSGWSDFVGFLSGALILLGVLLPWIVVASVVVVVWVMRARARKARVAAENPSTARKSAGSTKAVAAKK